VVAVFLEVGALGKNSLLPFLLPQAALVTLSFVSFIASSLFLVCRHSLRIEEEKVRDFAAAPIETLLHAKRKILCERTPSSACGTRSYAFLYS